MPNLNKVMLMGNLTRDPEVKYTPQGSPVAKFSVAVNREWKGKDGEKQKETQFFNIVVWGKIAEICGQYLAKGRPVFVDGRLTNRSWEKDGQKHYATEITAENVQFLGSKPQSDSAPGDQEPPPDAEPTGDVPF